MTGNIRGVLAMMISMAAFTVGDTIIKIVGRSLPVGEILFLRGLFSIALTCLLIWWTDVWPDWPRAKGALIAWRTIAEVMCSVMFFVGLMYLPFADVAAIGQFTPLAVTAGAALFLGETVGWRRWAATLVGLVGVLFIIQPGSSGFQWAALYIVASVLGIATRDLITRQISHDVPALIIAAISSVAICGFGLAMATLETWVYPSPQSVVLLAVAAVTVTTGYYWVIVAMRTGEPAVVAPFRYSAMLFALVSSFFVFEERPNATSMLGVALVIAAGIYTLHREQVRRREAIAREKSTGALAAEQAA
jgi:drug/metabolite transporter (DMT)-like permease